MTCRTRSVSLRFLILSLTAAVIFGCFAPACKRDKTASSSPPEHPSVRLYVVSTLAGALEPCGCQKDMLGGIDHAAAFVASQKTKAPHFLVLGAGPMLFMDPEIDDTKETQDTWKAEAIASSLGELGLSAWAPGANDWALGAGRLAKLRAKAHADLLAANLEGATAGALPGKVYSVGKYRVGVVGVAEPKYAGQAPSGVEVDPLEGALASGRQELDEDGAQILVALVAAPRGRALRLAEKVRGFDVMIVGKSFDRGEGNDAPIPPVTVNQTLVVQAPNHLQQIAAIDLYVRDDDFDFEDGAGLAITEKRDSLERRIGELERRIAHWESTEGVSADDLAARRRDLSALEKELGQLKAPAPPREGSFYDYSLTPIRERLGSHNGVAGRMDAYYRRVNEHNKKAFADREPEPAGKGKSGYLGAEDCSMCHDEEYAFWKTTPHARAYATLADEHKEFNLDCVSCHVTGYEEPGGSTVTHVSGLTNVQCEVCHGPGSRHEDDPEDPALIVAKPDRSLCAAKCHHPPHVGEEWNAAEAWKHIIGPGHGKPAQSKSRDGAGK